MMNSVKIKLPPHISSPGGLFLSRPPERTGIGAREDRMSEEKAKLYGPDLTQ
jgi:hypothetical protein